MARIRTVKPELWTSPQIASCSRDSRLTFIGLLNFCDDNGIHPASASRLRLELFPEDDLETEDIRGFVEELLRAGLLATYLVDDEAFWVVTGWARHQKIDRPTYRHPLPDGRFGAPLTDEERRRVTEESPRKFAEFARRIDSPNSLAEQTRRGSSGTEWNGVEGSKPPSHRGESVPTTSTTEYTDGGDFENAPRKFPMAGGAE